MDHKTRIAETNNMRNLMGLNVFSENMDDEAVGNDKDENPEDEVSRAEELEEMENIDDKGDDPGIVMGAEGGWQDSVQDKTNIEKGEVYSEDSEGEETYNYGDDEGHDKEEEDRLEDEEKMAPEDRIKEIEKHLDALKKDMGYDEDREDRDEKGTDFYEQKTFNIKKNGKVITLSESEIKKLSKLI